MDHPTGRTAQRLGRSPSCPPRPALFSGIRDKLFGIMVVLKVLPLIALSVFAIRQIDQFGITFKGQGLKAVPAARAFNAACGKTEDYERGRGD